MKEELGEQLKVARDASDRSLQSVAEAAKVSTAYLHKLESGVVNSPNPRLLLRLAEELQISYPALMHAAEYQLPTAEEQAQAAQDAPSAIDARPSRSNHDGEQLPASNTDIMRLLQETLTRIDALAEQQATLLQAVSPPRP